MELVLNREYYAQGTNGILSSGNRRICCTIELPWKNNYRNISCIPEGRYELVKRYRPRFGDHFLLKEVPRRSYILVHAFNNALEESRGCIAPVSDITGEGKGIFSRLTLKKLTDLLYP